MEAARRAGRIVGVLILVQMLGGFLVNFTLEAPLFGSPGFLANAAPHARQIGLAVLLGLVTEALWLAIAVTALPIFYQRARSLAFWFLALATVVLSLAVLENAGVMSMVSVSQAYAKAGDAQRGQLETVRVVVASARNWAHFMARMVDGATIFVFYVVLYRLAAVPRAIAGFGLLAVTSMIASVSMPLFGGEVIFPMLAPLGLSQLSLAAWLMAKGFRGDR